MDVLDTRQSSDSFQHVMMMFWILLGAGLKVHLNVLSRWVLMIAAGPHGLSSPSNHRSTALTGLIREWSRPSVCNRTLRPLSRVCTGGVCIISSTKGPLYSLSIFSEYQVVLKILESALLVLPSWVLGEDIWITSFQVLCHFGFQWLPPYTILSQVLSKRYWICSRPATPHARSSFG
jgi:hypothetical protein